MGESFCIPVSSISSSRSFVCDPRVVYTCVSSRARSRTRCDIRERECHIAQKRKRLKNARETALFGARVPARRGVARVVSRTHTLARAPYTFSRASLVRARSHAREAATFRAVPRCVSARGCLGAATRRARREFVAARMHSRLISRGARVSRSRGSHCTARAPLRRRHLCDDTRDELSRTRHPSTLTCATSSQFHKSLAASHRRVFASSLATTSERSRFSIGANP